LGERRTKTAGSTADTQAHQLNAAVRVIDACRTARGVVLNNTENVLLYITEIMPGIKMFLLSSTTIKNFGWG